MRWRTRAAHTGPASGSAQPTCACVRAEATSSNVQQPVRAHVERQLLEQAIDQAGTVLVQKGDEADGALLRLASGKRLGLRVLELAAQRLVLALGGLDDLAVQLLQVVLHAADGRTRHRFERGVNLLDVLGEILGPSLEQLRELGDRRLEPWWELRFEELVQR